jgi:hypothetical protein
MRTAALVPILLALTLALAPAPAVALKKIPYPEVKVEGRPAFKGDTGLDALRKKLADAIAKKDLAALASLVAPNFTWTAAGSPVEDFDPKRDAVHNFKVAFGFRSQGKDADGKTEIGPLWELLAWFVQDQSLSAEPDRPDLICGPTTAKLVDPKAYEQATEKLDTDDELSEWVFFLAAFTLTGSPGGGGPAVAKVANMALPLVGAHPIPAPGQPPKQPPTHVELLLPSGKTGWAPLSAVLPLTVDRLCYAKTSGGDWKIAVYDQAE